MRILISILCLMVFCGCISKQPLNTYTEGTSLTIGLYIPYNGTIYGLQAVNYLSGKRIQLTTNQNFKVESNHSVSNKSFGVFELIDDSKTKIGE